MRLHVFGSGPLESILPTDDPGVVYHGSVRYAPDWISFVTENVDALLIPHLQSDPSCTYLEGMGCAVPFISYANRTAVALAERSDAAWLAPLRDTHALAQRVTEVSRDSEELARRGRNALTFAQEHTFEVEYAKRAEHLRRAYHRSQGR